MPDKNLEIDNSIFEKYLKILNVPVVKPDIDTLKQLINSHLTLIPFENISKIYYNKKFGLNYIPSFEQYIEGIEKYHFGGTCYSNNYYFYLLLDHLGYKIKLCGADMSKPDVHVVSVVTIDDREYIVDVGYAAPFFEPMPQDLTTESEIIFGDDKFLLLPKDVNGYSQIKHYRNSSLIHGYAVNPRARTISEFESVIKYSYNEKSTFMNSVMLVKYGKNSSKVIHNFSSIEFQNNSYQKRKLQNKDELAMEIENIFGIPEEVSQESLSFLSKYFDAWN